MNTRQDNITQFQPGNLIQLRGREWIVLSQPEEHSLRIRPLAGSAVNSRLVYIPLENPPPVPASFPLPDASKSGSHLSGLLLRDACRLRLRVGAGPFRSFAHLHVRPRAYQLVPLMMALTHEVVRLLIADDVGIGKTIEASLIARELLDRGEIDSFSVISPPHLCEQWKQELKDKFLIDAEVVKPTTVKGLERGLPAGKSLFEVYPYTIVSLDYIKGDRHRDEFVRTCPPLVIVEEAHCCVGGAHSQRHQRFRLLQALCKDPQRHLILLTATPHSGDEEAFYNLLGLLDDSFRQLQSLEKGAQRDALREKLARHLVQRRRADIEEWKDGASFPCKKSLELGYKIAGDFQRFFLDLKDYVEKSMHESTREKPLGQGKAALDFSIMHHWTALGLLRCASSSPAAVLAALRNRKANMHAQDSLSSLEDPETMGCLVDEDPDTEEVLSDIEPLLRGADSPYELLISALEQQLLEMHSPKSDPKLAVLIKLLKEWLAEGVNPVIFCRYVSTAEYLYAQLQKALKSFGANIRWVSGRLSPDERRLVIDQFESALKASPRVLISTDCLSEGVNLQHAFDAIIHYDLPWNPCRLEQREGRVDRYGQKVKVVRAATIYGENNPVDQTVLQVIHRKIGSIQRELGVSIPIPVDQRALAGLILETVVGTAIKPVKKEIQLEWDFGDASVISSKFKEDTKAAAHAARTLYSQSWLRPTEVIAEWHKMNNLIGDENDVRLFVQEVCYRLGAPLEKASYGYWLPVSYLPKALKESLEAFGYGEKLPLSFSDNCGGGIEHLHRSHPVVLALAEYLAECSLCVDRPELAARSSALFTTEVKELTTLFLLRLRHSLSTEYAIQGRKRINKTMVVEEILTLEHTAMTGLRLLCEDEARGLWKIPPHKNIPPERRQSSVQEGLDLYQKMHDTLHAICKERAEVLKCDHERVRSASQVARRARAWSCAIQPAGFDLLSLSVLVPAIQF